MCATLRSNNLPNPLTVEGNASTAIKFNKIEKFMWKIHNGEKGIEQILEIFFHSDNVKNVESDDVNRLKESCKLNTALRGY